PSPPYARQPAISYLSPTRSPLAREGAKENRVRSRGQKPAVSPGRSPRGCPTGPPQTRQARRLTGPWGSGRITRAGSCAGGAPAGACTRPAPSRPWRWAWLRPLLRPAVGPESAPLATAPEPATGRLTRTPRRRSALGWLFRPLRSLTSAGPGAGPVGAAP